MTRIWRRRLKRVFAAGLSGMLLAPGLGAVAGLPGRVVLRVGGSADLPVCASMDARVDAPAVAGLDAGPDSALRVTGARTGEAELTLSVLGVPLRRVKLAVEPERVLIPGGQSVGVAIRTAGVVVVGASDLGATPSPARLAGLKSGDVIETIDGAPVTGARALSESLAGRATAVLGVRRGGEAIQCTVKPAVDARDGVARLGAWVRDSTAGVGTLTFYDPATGAFGALGHAITDVDTGALMPVGAGEIFENAVVEITPSRQGAPGELAGDFFGAGRAMGEVRLNTACGIFGQCDALESAAYPAGLPVAPLRDVREGPATLLTTVEGSAPKAYACEVVRLNARSDASRAMVIRVTDPGLIARTGGIVQGMSGSPIVQNGRIIGALTHVMVNDPAMGYAIGIEAMLEAADGLEKANAA